MIGRFGLMLNLDVQLKIRGFIEGKPTAQKIEQALKNASSPFIPSVMETLAVNYLIMNHLLIVNSKSAGAYS